MKTDSQLSTTPAHSVLPTSVSDTISWGWKGFDTPQRPFLASKPNSGYSGRVHLVRLSGSIALAHWIIESTLRQDNTQRTLLIMLIPSWEVGSHFPFDPGASFWYSSMGCRIIFSYASSACSMSSPFRVYSPASTYAPTSESEVPIPVKGLGQ